MTRLALVLLAAAAGAADGAAPPTPCGPAVEGMACIAAGAFLRGRDDGPTAERPRAEVWLDAFYMDVYEVTSEAYRACVAAGGCRDAGPNYKGFSRPRQPIVGIKWFDARDFCRWRGGRLPSEAEWEKAARGSDGRLYPWGNERATCKRAVILDAKVSAENGCGKGATAEVGTHAPNPFGLYDMAGNSWEWVADWYAPYRACGAACAGKNPRGPCGGADDCPGHDQKLVRGGSWFWNWQHATTTRRRPHYPKNKPFHHFGFRCAKDAASGATP